MREPNLEEMRSNPDNWNLGILFIAGFAW